MIHFAFTYFLVIIFFIGNASFSTLLFAQGNQEKITLWATYYNMPSVSHKENGIELLNEKGEGIGLKLSPDDWCNAAIEGTVAVKKDTQIYILNYAGRSKEIQYDCRRCSKYQKYDGYIQTGKVLWKLSNGFGNGVKNYKLVPFLSIAVDSSVIPYGSVLYIPKAKGIPYINAKGVTTEHDGYFFASDTGSKINGTHIDVFLGAAKENPFSFITSDSKGTFEAYKISDKEIIKKLENFHR